mmetsp:Transcript_24359/g.56749  ORF Transcript_24359/g.56749 Transcript_24359/m.56749 type:complete len:166 (-) Transcript_24359:93-590(-)
MLSPPESSTEPTCNSNKIFNLPEIMVSGDIKTNQSSGRLPYILGCSKLRYLAFVGHWSTCGLPGTVLLLGLMDNLGIPRCGLVGARSVLHLCCSARLVLDQRHFFDQLKVLEFRQKPRRDFCPVVPLHRKGALQIIGFSGREFGPLLVSTPPGNIILPILNTHTT